VKPLSAKRMKDSAGHIVKYFRNTRMPAAWHKAAGGKVLIVPQDVRWNTMAD